MGGKETKPVQMSEVEANSNTEIVKPIGTEVVPTHNTPSDEVLQHLLGVNFNSTIDQKIEPVYLILFLKEIGTIVLGEDNFPSDIVFHIASFLVCNKFTHESDFDTNGILYWLGTFQNTTTYQHPFDIGLVSINPPSFYCGTPRQAFSYEMPMFQNWLERPIPHSWAEIEFLYHSVLPTAYTIRHGYPIRGHALRNWEFQARNPSEPWETLLEHVNDCTIPGNSMSDTATFKLPEGKQKQYSIFRIFRTGETSDDSPYLMMSGFEIYGYLFSERRFGKFC